MHKGKKLFLAATRQNDGKTVVCIGLLIKLMQVAEKIGFIKPVGQKYVEVDGVKVDEDAVLVSSLTGINCTELKNMALLSFKWVIVFIKLIEIKLSCN